MINKYLINAQNTFRVSTVADALKLRDELSSGDFGELVSFNYTTKQVTQKGEVVEEYVIVKAKLEFQNVKEPENSLLDVKYVEREVNIDEL